MLTFLEGFLFKIVYNWAIFKIFNDNKLALMVYEIKKKKNKLNILNKT